MAILPLSLCYAVFFGVLLLFPVGKCQLALIALVILLDNR